MSRSNKSSSREYNRGYPFLTHHAPDETYEAGGAVRRSGDGRADAVQAARLREAAPGLSGDEQAIGEDGDGEEEKEEDAAVSDWSVSDTEPIHPPNDPRSSSHDASGKQVVQDPPNTPKRQRDTSAPATPPDSRKRLRPSTSPSSPTRSATSTAHQQSAGDDGVVVTPTKPHPAGISNSLPTPSHTKIHPATTTHTSPPSGTGQQFDKPSGTSARLLIALRHTKTSLRSALSLRDVKITTLQRRVTELKSQLTTSDALVKALEKEVATLRAGQQL